MPRSAEPTARIFFALLPPPAAQRALGDFARETARRAHGRPVPAENMHVTLAFVGTWPLARLPALLDAAVAVRGEALHLVLDEFGAFRRAGIAWIGTSTPPGALMQAAASLADVLTPAGVVLDAQPFRPHMTLARHCRGPYPRGVAGPFSFVADRFSLMQSETHSEGARYRQLAAWPLR
jgi:2'-5' RNA ligase